MTTAGAQRFAPSSATDGPPGGSATPVVSLTLVESQTNEVGKSLQLRLHVVVIATQYMMLIDNTASQPTPPSIMRPWENWGEGGGLNHWYAPTIDIIFKPGVLFVILCPHVCVCVCVAFRRLWSNHLDL